MADDETGIFKITGIQRITPECILKSRFNRNEMVEIVITCEQVESFLSVLYYVC